MILWTPMPMEMVLDGIDGPSRPSLEVKHHGRTLMVEPISAAHARVVRLISSDPADYLDPAWQPGRVITLASTMM